MATIRTECADRVKAPVLHSARGLCPRWPWIGFRELGWIPGVGSIRAPEITAELRRWAVVQLLRWPARERPVGSTWNDMGNAGDEAPRLIDYGKSGAHLVEVPTHR